MRPEPDFLARYHGHPGRTPRMLLTWRDDEERNSYEVLASRLEAFPRDHRILDVACGDGWLLQILQRHGFTRLAGLDRSEQELAAARERLGPAVGLHHMDARSTALPSESFDVIVLHMALMLLTPVEQVLGEVARLCRPEGWLLAVLNRPLRDRAFEAFRAQLHRATREAGMERPSLGDPRTMSHEGLRELLGSGAFDPRTLHIRDFVVRLRAPPDVLWSKLRLLYDVAWLPPDVQDRLGERTQVSWRSLAPDGEPLACSMGMRLVEARTAASLGIKTAPADTPARARSP